MPPSQTDARVDGHPAEARLAFMDNPHRTDLRARTLALHRVSFGILGGIELRRAVFERDGGKCTECGSTFDLQYDHVIPVALGGATTADNLELLCADCNRSKGADL
jgi:hypothetical protein